MFMENLKLQEKEQQTGQKPTPKRPYEPPTATFVPLKLEERLLSCLKRAGFSICDRRFFS